MEEDSTVLVSKPTTCQCWSQISSPIPSQATKLNILTAPAIGVQGTPPSPQIALRPLKRPSNTPRFQAPASETPPTDTLTPEAAFPLLVLCSLHSPAPSLCSAGAARPAGWGRGAHVPAPPPPRQCPGERSARPARPIPLPPTLTPSLVSSRSAGPAGRGERSRGRCGSGRSPEEPPGHEAPATPEPAEAHDSAEPARPSRPRTSAAGAGRDARRGGGGARGPRGGTCRDVGGARAPAGAGARARLELGLAVAQTLILACAAALPGGYGCPFWQRHRSLSFPQ